MSYYKFRPISRYLIESIVTPSVCFSKPPALNDPFDCQLNIKSLFEDKRFATDNRLIKVKEHFRTSGFLKDIPSRPGFLEHGIFCVSKPKVLENETLMWSHYADQHKGVRLKYNFDSYPFPPDQGFMMSTDVFYDEENKFLECLVESDKTDYEFYSEFCARYLTVKHPAWTYEQEFRFVRPTPGAVKIEPVCLEEVCFGLNTSVEDMNLIAAYASKYCGCKVFKRKVRGMGLFDCVDEEYK